MEKIYINVNIQWKNLNINEYKYKSGVLYSFLF